MRLLKQHRIVLAFTAVAVTLSPAIASAQNADQPPPSDTAATPYTSQATADQQPVPASQAAQSDPPAPIPVPPLKPSGGGLHIDSTALLVLGAVILGGGAYLILHKKGGKSSTDNGGTTTP